MTIRNALYVNQLKLLCARSRLAIAQYKAIKDIPISQGDNYEAEYSAKQKAVEEYHNCYAELRQYADYEVEIVAAITADRVDFIKLEKAMREGKNWYNDKRKMLEKTIAFDKNTSNWFNDFVQVIFEMILTQGLKFDTNGDTNELLFKLMSEFIIEEQEPKNTASHTA